MSEGPPWRQRPAVLLDGTVGDPGLLGGKGAALDRLASWGLPVPPTAAVTTATYRGFVANVHLAALLDGHGPDGPSDQLTDNTFLSVEFDSKTASSISEAAMKVGGGGLLAVRSSATVEDLADSSFAGQYRSILEIDPSDTGALLDAVRLVFASLWHRTPRSYRRALGVSDDAAAMSVVLMQMVPAQRAGVVFTVDPGGSEAAARVEVVDGLGESLVSGERTPLAWVLDREQPDATAPIEVRQALDLAMRAELLAGSPQDVEWAWDGSRTWVIQARPITTAVAEDGGGDGFDDELGDEDLTTTGISEMLPGVLPPLLWEINSHLVEEAFRNVLDGLAISSGSVPGPHHLIRRVRGRAALDFGRLQAMAAALPGAAAEHLEEQYFGSRRGGRSVASPPANDGRGLHLIHDLRVMASGRRNTVNAETVIEAAAELVSSEPDAKSFTDRELLRYRLGLIDLGVRAMGAELGVAAAAAAAYRRVEMMLLPHVGENEAGRLAEKATAGLDIGPIDTAASAAVFAGPTWSDLALEPPLVSARVGRPSAEKSFASLVDDLDTSESWSSEGIVGVLRVRALEHAVTEARMQLERRERTKAALLRLGGAVRVTHTEIGRRLCERGTLEMLSDVELLISKELTPALNGSAPNPSTIARRRRFRLSYERESPLPVRFTGTPEMSALDWTTDGRHEGWAASGGRCTGKGRVIRSPQEHLEPGEILVAEATDASWSPLFLNAAAIVVERGGPLSHAAILARELGVPAVLNVPGATRSLGGQVITVDGDSGLVLVHDDAASEAPP